MDNENIKEILNNLEFTNNDYMWCDTITLNVKQSHLLLDYITNLQKSQETLIKNDNEIITNLQEEQI